MSPQAAVSLMNLCILRKPAFVQQVDDELELVHNLVIGNFWLVARFNECLESGNNKLCRAAAEHRLLAEQVRFSFFGERRFDNAGTRTADSGRIGKGDLQRIAAGILMHGNEAGYAVTFFILASYEPAGSLRSNQGNIEVGTRLDLLIVNSKAMRESSSVAPSAMSSTTQLAYRLF